MGKTYRGLDSLQKAFEAYKELGIKEEKEEVEKGIEEFSLNATKNENKPIPVKHFVEPVKVDEAEAVKKVEAEAKESNENGVDKFIRERTNGFSYEYILAEDLMVIKGLGKKMPNMQRFSAKVIVEGEARLSELRKKLNDLRFRIRNQDKMLVETSEIKTFFIRNEKFFKADELDILKRTVVTEFGRDKASEILGENVVTEIIKEDEKYNSEKTR